MGISTNDGRVERLIAETTEDFTGNPEGDIAVIYDTLNAADPEIRDVILNGSRESKEEFLHELLTSEKCAFRDFCMDPKTGGYAEGYLECILGIYEGYVSNPPEDIGKDLNWLAARTVELVMHGLKGVK